MASTIHFADAQRANGSRVCVPLSVECANGTTIAAETSVICSYNHRVTFLTATIDDGRLHWKTTLDPNESENDFDDVAATVLDFVGQDLVLPTNNIEVALRVAHQVVSGGADDWD